MNVSTALLRCCHKKYLIVLQFNRTAITSLGALRHPLERGNNRTAENETGFRKN